MCAGVRVCVWIRGIIYIQVVYLTAPVASSHSTPTRKSALHTPVLCSVFVYDLLHNGCFQQPVSRMLKIFPGSHLSTHIPLLSHELLERVNIMSQLLAKPCKVSVCLQFVALSFLCESDGHRDAPLSRASHMLRMWWWLLWINSASVRRHRFITGDCF